MSKLSLWRNSSTFSNLGTGCSFLLETLCLHAGIAERSKSFQIQNIQDFFDLVQMEGSTSPTCRALLKAVNFSFQKRMTNLFPCSSCLSLFFRALPCLQKGKRRCATADSITTVSNPAHMDGQVGLCSVQGRSHCQVTLSFSLSQTRLDVKLILLSACSTARLPSL